MFTAEATPDVGTFLARVRRLDPAALVRMRPGRRGGVELWTVLPIGVLATLTVPGDLGDDSTVRADELVAAVSGGQAPSPRDSQWRGALPMTARSVLLEEIDAAEIQRIGESAAQTLTQARGKGVGDRRLRDALLDHVALTVSAEGREYQIRLRLIMGLLRMGFAPHGTVKVLRIGERLGLEGIHGSVWNPAAGLTILLPPPR